MKNAANIALIGPTGAGKSSIGRMLAGALDLVPVELDREIETLVGAPIPTIFAERDEAYFRDRESEALTQALQRDGILLITGAGAILRESNRALISSRAFVVHIDISVDEQLRRLRKDHTRPLLQSPDRERILRDMADVRGPLYQAISDLRFDGETYHSPKSACAQLLTSLSRRWTRP